MRLPMTTNVTRVALATAVLLGLGLAANYLSTARIVDTTYDRARTQLQMAAAALQQQSKTRRGGYPDSPRLLHEAFRDHPHRNEVLTDPWGSPVLLQCLSTDCRNAIIYSAGENRIDEKGKGDDIVVQLPQSNG